MQLIIANKNYSSWSMRPWVLAVQFDLPFEERVIGLGQAETAQNIRAYSPSGRLPCLIDGDITVWDSLAICETLAERYPEKALWPREPARRAHARSVSAEMHSGFGAVRSAMPMNIRGRARNHMLSADESADIARLEALWGDCLKRYGGPFLFGEFSIADAMFAPVAMRFNTYSPPLSLEAAGYVRALTEAPSVQRWIADARADGVAIDYYDSVL
jgi:glutathione S-transferase